MQHRARLLALAACLPFLASSVLPDGQFAKLSLTEALAKAGEAKKVVMVDFFTTWCGPCKKLDAETWTDPRVNGWLAEHAVAIKLDAEKEKDAAKQHRIGAYPTMLFLKPDGTEVGRMVGFRSPEAFLREADNLLAGKTRLDTVREQVQRGGENDPMLRQDLGEELADAGRYEEALEHFLWCWDHGLEHSPSYVGVRGSFLIGRIRSLARDYPAALEAMRQRRDACEAALMSGQASRQLVRDFPDLNELCGKRADTLRVYDAVGSREELAPEQREEVRHALFDAVLDDLLKAGRYQDVLDGAGDYNSAVDSQMEVCAQVQAVLKDDPMTVNHAKWQAVSVGANYYEALLGIGRVEAARGLAERLIAFDPRAGTFKTLARRAEKAKADAEAASLRERGKQAKQE